MRIIFIVLIFCLSVNVDAQEKDKAFSYEFRISYGAFKMADLKEYNKILNVFSGLDTRVVENFPPFFSYSFRAITEDRNVIIGLIGSIMSTGSRISLYDYSGEYKFDMTITAFCPGIYVGDCIKIFNKHQLAFGSNLVISYSKLKMYEFLSVGSYVDIDDKLNTKSLGFILEPEAAVRLNLSEKFGMAFSMGWAMQLYSQDLYYKIREITLINPLTEKNIKPDWSGFRLGVSVYY